MGLLREVAQIAHPSNLGEPTKMHLAPAPPGVGLAEGTHKRTGLGAQLVLGLDASAKSLAELRMRAPTIQLNLLQRLVHSCQRVLDWRDHLLNGFLTLLQIGTALRLRRSQVRRERLEELLAAGIESLASALLDLGYKVLPRLGKQPDLLRGRLALAVQLDLDSRESCV